MMNNTCRQIVCALITVALCACSASAQAITDKARDDAVKAHTAAARAAANEDFKGSLNMCTPPAPAQPGPRGGGGQRNTQQAPNDAVEASQAFDNLYFVGLRSVAAWAIKTSGG